MTIQELKGKSVAILGLGANNRELAAYLLGQGVALTIRDRKLEVMQQFEAQYPQFKELIDWEISEDTLHKLERFQVVFRTPFIPYLSPALQKAKAKGVVIYSQTRLFFDLCPAPIIGVSGTKGKGTTCSLIYGMLSQGYPKGKTYLGGNIGVDPFSFLAELTANDLVVLELSSFQLQDLHKSPHVGVLLRVGQDHLDHHQSVKEYREAKLSLLRYQTVSDIAIANDEDPQMESLLVNLPGKLYRYAKFQPRRQSAWVDQSNDQEVLFLQLEGEIESIDISQRKLLGNHNLENILPAAMVGALYQITPKLMQQVIIGFEGLPHRLHRVGSFENIDFYDDSMATTPDATLTALAAFPERRVHLILGGKDKGQTYPDAWLKTVAARCPTVSLLPGKISTSLGRSLEHSSQQLQVLSKAQEPIMETILSGIHPHLQRGDVVLLAPSAASDLPYANYKERGEAFEQAVFKRYDQ